MAIGTFIEEYNALSGRVSALYDVAQAKGATESMPATRDTWHLSGYIDSIPGVGNVKLLEYLRTMTAMATPVYTGVVISSMDWYDLELSVDLYARFNLASRTTGGLFGIQLDSTRQAMLTFASDSTKGPSLRYMANNTYNSIALSSITPDDWHTIHIEIYPNNGYLYQRCTFDGQLLASGGQSRSQTPLKPFGLVALGYVTPQRSSSSSTPSASGYVSSPVELGRVKIHAKTSTSPVTWQDADLVPCCIEQANILGLRLNGLYDMTCNKFCPTTTRNYQGDALYGNDV